MEDDNTLELAVQSVGVQEWDFIRFETSARTTPQSCDYRGLEQQLSR